METIKSPELQAFPQIHHSVLVQTLSSSGPRCAYYLSTYLGRYLYLYTVKSVLSVGPGRSSPRCTGLKSGAPDFERHMSLASSRHSKHVAGRADSFHENRLLFGIVFPHKPGGCYLSHGERMNEVSGRRGRACSRSAASGVAFIAEQVPPGTAKGVSC